MPAINNCVDLILISSNEGVTMWAIMICVSATIHTIWNTNAWPATVMNIKGKKKEQINLINFVHRMTSLTGTKITKSQKRVYA